jgi:2',3'-cyclic-nucleotide 2'-phosphodiesterase (5'-nucleotidase family)
MRRITTAALIVLAALFVVPAAMAGRGGDGAKDNDTRLQILAINDFHGHVEPNTPGTIQVGQTRVGTTIVN